MVIKEFLNPYNRWKLGFPNGLCQMVIIEKWDYTGKVDLAQIWGWNIATNDIPILDK